MHPRPEGRRIAFMKFPSIKTAALLGLTLLLVAGALFVASQKPRRMPSAATAHSSVPEAKRDVSIDLILTQVPGDEKIDAEIAKLQEQIKDAPRSTALIGRLGWTFVTKARISNDPGFYKLAEQCATIVLAQSPDEPDATLLRGHIDDALHRFHDAEMVARSLIARREFVFDYALLGDALMEQGHLAEAVVAYQKMVDLKPCLQTYSRVAHMRWLKGDLAGAIAAARVAVSSGSFTEPEPLAWASTQLALYLLQQNEVADAFAASQEASRFVPNYAPALLIRGRASLAQGKLPEAVVDLQRAADLSPLPQYLWTLADALRAKGQLQDADVVEKKLRATGMANDPRTLSLFLASRATDAPTALRLAQAELRDRQDVLTHDAMAWAEFANGHIAEAQREASLAMAEGTQDARIFYHAGVIAASSGKTLDALTLLNKADQYAPALLPSERADLAVRLGDASRGAAQVSER